MDPLHPIMQRITPATDNPQLLHMLIRHRRRCLCQRMQVRDRHVRLRYYHKQVSVKRRTLTLQQQSILRLTTHRLESAIVRLQVHPRRQSQACRMPGTNAIDLHLCLLRHYLLVVQEDRRLGT